VTTAVTHLQEEPRMSTTTGTVDAAWLVDRTRTQTSPRVRVLDVRTPAEFETAHIRGSYNVPLDLLKEHRDELAGALDDQVVLVCRSGQRAEQAERALAQAGLGNLRVLSGGISAWEQHGADLVRGHRRWELERQVRLVAGSIVLTSVAVSVVVPPATWVAAAIGAGLTLAAATDSCLMGTLLSRLPYNRRGAADPQAVVDELLGRR
jgi:rhodanese-related sulfurtransferase